MNKNTKINLFLLSTVLLLVCGLYLAQEKNKHNKDLRLPINPSELNSITIQHSNKIRLNKLNDEWHMIWPIQGKVKLERIEKMLTHLMLPLEGDFSSQNADLALYGLDKPRMQVTLKSNQNNDTLSFGALSTMQQMHYISFRNKIYLARPFLQISFDKSVEDLLVHTEHK